MKPFVYISAPERMEHALPVGEERTVCGFHPDLDMWTVVGSTPLIEAFVCGTCKWLLERDSQVPKPRRAPAGREPRHHLWEVRIGPSLRAFCEALEAA
jgi:hypothetical protein